MCQQMELIKDRVLVRGYLVLILVILLSPWLGTVTPSAAGLLAIAGGVLAAVGFVLAAGLAVLPAVVFALCWVLVIRRALIDETPNGSAAAPPTVYVFLDLAL